MPTEYGGQPPKIKEKEEAAEFFSPLHLTEVESKIDRASQTWKAVRQYVEEQVRQNYLPTLRNRAISHDETQYARGGFDALESLLAFGGESIEP